MRDGLYKSCPREAGGRGGQFHGANIQISKKKRKKREGSLICSLLFEHVILSEWRKSLSLTKKNLPYPRACKFLRGKLLDRNGTKVQGKIALKSIVVSCPKCSAQFSSHRLCKPLVDQSSRTDRLHHRERAVAELGKRDFRSCDAVINTTLSLA